MPNRPRRLILVLSGGRALLERVGIVEPVDLTPPALAAFRVHVWNAIKNIQPNASIEILLSEFRSPSGFPADYVYQCGTEYRKCGFEIQTGFRSGYGGEGVASHVDYMRVQAPKLAEKLTEARAAVQQLLPRPKKVRRWRIWRRKTN